MHPPIESRAGERGFSLLEGLIAAALLLIVTVGVLPLFTRSMLNNVKGNESTRQSFGTIDGFEHYIAEPFNSFDLTVPVGATEAVRTDFLALHSMPSSPGSLPVPDISWIPAVPAGDQQQFSRTRRLRQYSFSDFATSLQGAGSPTPLPGAVDPLSVQYKVTETTVRNATTPGQTYTVQFIQAF